MEKQRSLFEEHWSEVLLSAILLIATTVAWIKGGVKADTAEIIDVVTATLAIYVAILKGHFKRTADSLASRRNALDSRTAEISSILAELSGSNHDYAVPIVDSALDRLRLIPQGIVRLDRSAYYNELSSSLRMTKKGCHVSAVSSMSIDRWERDPRQIHYFEENLRAVKRGVAIHRVFIIDRSQMNGSYSDKVREIIQEQQAAKITVYVVWRENIRHDPELYDDFVLFNDSGIVYTDEPEKMDPTRVLGGCLVSNPKKVLKYKGVFQSLTETYCIDQSSLVGLLKPVGA
jgi:hypothetical protein